MSTTIRNVGIATRNAPISRRTSAAPPAWKRALAGVEKWAIAKPALASTILAVAYLAALLSLIAVIAASALNSVVGFVAMGLFAAMVLVCVAVAVYTVMPEKTVS